MGRDARSFVIDLLLLFLWTSFLHMSRCLDPGARALLVGEGVLICDSRPIMMPSSGVHPRSPPSPRPPADGAGRGQGCYKGCNVSDCWWGNLLTCFPWRWWMKGGHQASPAKNA